MESKGKWKHKEKWGNSFQENVALECRFQKNSRFKFSETEKILEKFSLKKLLESYQLIMKVKTKLSDFQGNRLSSYAYVLKDVNS